MSFILQSSADSNWAACLKTRRSTTGINVNIAGGAVGYKTKLQPTVAGSSAEAEFMAAYDAGKMVLFLSSIMYDLGTSTGSIGGGVLVHTR
jgi:hypothetical protein